MSLFVPKDIAAYTTSLESMKEAFVGKPMDASEITKEANQSLARAFLTEFEFKSGRQAARSRKKKEAINERIGEFTANVPRADWKVMANAALVLELQKLL